MCIMIITCITRTRWRTNLIYCFHSFYALFYTGPNGPITSPLTRNGSMGPPNSIYGLSLPPASSPHSPHRQSSLPRSSAAAGCSGWPTQKGRKEERKTRKRKVIVCLATVWCVCSVCASVKFIISHVSRNILLH